MTLNHAALTRYFDAAASTPLDPVCQEVLIQDLNLYSNNNSKHHAGNLAQKKIDQSLKDIAQVLNINWEQLTVTYSGTDANRKILNSCKHLFGAENIYASAVEHSSIADEIAKDNFFDPKNPDLFFETKNITSPKVICLMGANSETGEIYDASIIRKNYPESFIIRDFSQSFAKGILPDIENCDAAIFTPQKFYGPKHVGFLYLKSPEKFPEISKDSHTKAPYLVTSSAKAFEILKTENTQNLENTKKWDSKICDFIKKNIPDHKFHCEYNSSENTRVPGVISVSFKNLRGSELMAVLSKEEQICVSNGSACTSDMMSATTVMQFLEKDPAWQYPIRISLHKYLTDDAVNDFCEILEHYVSELRKK